MSTSRVTLPGSLTSLLCRGAPVRGPKSRTGPVDIVTHDPNGLHCMTVFEGLVEQAHVALDLTEPVGSDIAARWFGRHFRRGAHRVPYLVALQDDGKTLAWIAYDATTPFAYISTGGMPLLCVPRFGRLPIVKVPAVPDDATEALAAACLAVGGAS